MSLLKNCNSEMIVTTTNSIDKATIKQYLGVITTNHLAGTNFFSDFEASVTDILGISTGTYENKLKAIYSEALDVLKRKAKSLGANAIVGLKIDFDEISGKGKSMFMISVSGTAVQFEYDSVRDDRYDLYELLYKLKNYCDKGILSEEEYQFEKRKLMQRYHDPINQELTSENTRKEALVATIKREQEMVAILNDTKSVDIKRIQQKPLEFDVDGIINSDYSNFPIRDIASMDECIKIMIKHGSYNEACKYYIDETGLGVGDAMEHVRFLYASLLDEFPAVEE